MPKKEADELVALIATTRKDIVEREASPTPTPTGEKPLWDRLGGEAAVKAVVHDFVVLAAADPKVDFFRGGKYTLDAEGVANLERRLVELISAVSGGPLKYEGRDMKSVHEGMGITGCSSTPSRPTWSRCSTSTRCRRRRPMSWSPSSPRPVKISSRRNDL